jgi:type I restriction enzyme M protein
MNTITDIVQKLMAPAKHLHGVPIHGYLTELTWLLFLKTAPAFEGAAHVPTHLTWEILTHKSGIEQYEYYQKVIKELGQNRNPSIAGIYADARTSLKDSEQLTQVITALAAIDTVSIDELGEVYEMLLEKCAYTEENNLYIAPRSLVDFMTILTQPQSGEMIQDPLAGTASLVVAADQYIKITSDEIFEISLNKQKPKKQQFIAIEPNLVRQRLGLMNCLLHQMDYSSMPIQWGDSLLSDRQTWPLADVILSVLVFASEPADELYKHDVSVALLQHIYKTLKPGGRAAVVLPDKMLKATGPAQQVRTTLLDTCVLHTVLRLPKGIFYPHKVLAHVLFFKKAETKNEKTETVWFYDSRTNLPTFGQYLHLTREHLKPFEIVYGDDPLGQTTRVADGENGRWHCISRDSLSKQGDRLDLCWLQETDENIVTEDIWEMLYKTVEELELLTDILRE